MSSEHPLNTESNRVNGRKNLLKHGKIHALLDDMETDARSNIAEAELNLLTHYREVWVRAHKNLGPSYVEGKVAGDIDDIVQAYHRQMDIDPKDSRKGEELASLLQVQRDAFALARGIRKFTPFIEAGAMTIAEAISCETQRNAGKSSEK